MKRQEFRSLPNFSQQKHVNVDRENDTVKNIEIAKYGKNKNSSFFDEKFLNDLARKGNEQTQGVKSRFGHPNMCASSLGTYVGRYKNFRVENKRAYADLHLDPISKKTEVEGKGIKMYDYIMDMAESNSDMFGNSIVIMSDEYEGEVVYDDDEVKMETIKVLHSLLASDLVDDPAATDALFSVENDFGVVMTEFLDQNPEVFNIANEKPELFMDFLTRYEAYQSRKSINTNKNEKMNLIKSLKEKFGSNQKPDTFDIDLTLATGDIITVVSESETPQEGDAVQNAEGKPVEDGDHLLKDGRTVVTEGGKIDKINEAEPEGNGGGEGDEPTEDQNNFDTLQQEISGMREDFSNAINMISQQFEKQDEELTTLKRSVKSKSFKAPTKKERKVIKEEGEDSFEAKIAAQREAREKKNK